MNMEFHPGDIVLVEGQRGVVGSTVKQTLFANTLIDVYLVKYSNYVKWHYHRDLHLVSKYVPKFKHGDQIFVEELQETSTGNIDTVKKYGGVKHVRYAYGFPLTYMVVFDNNRYHENVLFQDMYI